jgi:hypothetical protein
MRRDRIVSAVNNLRDALQACQIRDLLRAARSGQPADGVNRTQNILLAYNVFTRHYQNFSEDEKEMMNYFGLAPLLDITFWSGLIDSDQSVSRKLLADVDVGAYNVIFVMPKLRELLTRENDRDELFLTDAGGREREMKRVRIMVAEKERSLTAPSVVTNIIRAMDELYESLATLYGETNVSLAIGGIDSGSAKSFDFFGATAVMGDIHTLLINVWDRIKYSTEETSATRSKWPSWRRASSAVKDRRCPTSFPRSRASGSRGRWRNPSRCCSAAALTPTKWTARAK